MQLFGKVEDSEFQFWRKFALSFIGIVLILTFGSRLFLHYVDRSILGVSNAARIRALEAGYNKGRPVMYVKDVLDLTKGVPIFIGLTTDEVRSAWGVPEKTEHGGLFGDRLFWHYGSVRLYFRDGVLFSVEPPVGVTADLNSNRNVLR